MFIDSHCHIYYETFDNDIADVINRAHDVGVTKLVCVGVDLESSESSINLADKYEDVYATVGFHPHESKLAESNYLNNLESMARHPKVVAIGEIGLDFHYNHSDTNIQKKIFIEQLELAKSINLPTVVHSRNADIETFEAISGIKKSRGVVHCFASDLKHAKKIIKLNYHISFTGLITFAKDLAEVVKEIPLKNILIETDSPYLSPIPFRGKRNEPQHVIEIAKEIAHIKGVDLSVVENETTRNTLNLFNKIKL